MVGDLFVGDWCVVVCECVLVVIDFCLVGVEYEE